MQIERRYIEILQQRELNSGIAFIPDENLILVLN